MMKCLSKLHDYQSQAQSHLCAFPLSPKENFVSLIELKQLLSFACVYIL